jgi:hypothetical protein
MELPRPGNSRCKSGLLTPWIVLGVLLFSGQDRDSLGVLLNRAADNARRYTDAMRNLTAEEVRLTELFDKSGKLSQRRKTVSDLVVHTAGTDTLSEFRSVREVDGKAIKGGESRLENLLKRLSGADSLTKELELIDLESSRYDLGDMRMKGMALNQAWPLEEDQFRRTAQFTREGIEIISGRNTVVLRFEMPSLAESPQTRSLVELLKPSRLFIRGRVWIDSETAEILRYETETMVEETPGSQPLMWDRMEFYYVPSSFGVPTPRKIVWVSNSTVSREKGKLKLSLKGRVTADYGPFKRFGTDVQIVPLGVR